MNTVRITVEHSVLGSVTVEIDDSLRIPIDKGMCKDRLRQQLAEAVEKIHGAYGIEKRP